jgi:hypothetical protein
MQPDRTFDVIRDRRMGSLSYCHSHAHAGHRDSCDTESTYRRERYSDTTGQGQSDYGDHRE